MNLRNINKMKAEKGFTIVELLIVIVVIGILAAIVIVAYNGVSNRAKTTKANAAASTLVKKLEAYNAEVGNYPATFSLLSGATSDKSYYTTGLSLATSITNGTPPSTGESTVVYYATGCASPSGIKVGYYDYTTGTQAFLYTNGATAASTGCAAASS